MHLSVTGRAGQRISFENSSTLARRNERKQLFHVSEGEPIFQSRVELPPTRAKILCGEARAREAITRKRTKTKIKDSQQPPTTMQVD